MLTPRREDAAIMRRTSRSPILVVDDSDEDIFLFRLLLKRIGATAPFVPMLSSAAVLTWLDTLAASDAVDRPFVCFLDIKMPQVGGLEVLRAIRERETLSWLPVIMLSSSDDERDIRAAADLGAQAFVQKYPSTGALSALLAHASAYVDGVEKDKAFDQPYNLLRRDRISTVIA